MSYNFSEHYAAVKGPDKIIEVRGDEFVLPPSLPVSFYLMQNDMEDMTVTDVEFTLLCHLFTKPVVDGWVKAGMSADEYKALINYIGTIYAPKIDADELSEESEEDPKEVGTS